MTLLRTGIGSLPHAGGEEAVDFVLRTCDIPYLPQLPNRHIQESMLLQWGDGLAGAGQNGPGLLMGAPPGDRTQAFGGAAAMLRHVPGDVVKTQVTGPVTLAAALRSGGVDQPGLLGRVTEELLPRIVKHLDWVRSETAVDTVVLVIDEPALAALGATQTELPDAARQSLAMLLDTLDVEVGIHCCGDTDWGAVAGLGFEWLSWDLGALGGGFFSGIESIAVALANGTRIMWGIVPTTPGPLPDTNVLIGRYGTAVANLVVAGAPLEMLKSRAWFTPACGLAGLSVGDAEAVANRLGQVVGEVENGW